MGLLDRFKKKKTEENDVRGEKVLEDEEKMGWDAITAAFEKIYPDQKSPRHYAPIRSMRMGGEDPLDGISVYDAGDAWHFVSYGLSEIYGKETTIKEISGFGMEFTFKLKKGCYDDEEMEIKGVCGIMQTLAKVTFSQSLIFGANESIYTGQTKGMDVHQLSKITGFITQLDPIIQFVDTENGRLDFVRLIGATDAELKAIHEKKLSVEELYEKLGSDVTDFRRDSVL